MNKPIKYYHLVQLLGIFILLFALYHVFRIATASVHTSDKVFYLIEFSFEMFLVETIRQGVLLYVALGGLFLGLSSRRLHIVYWSVQVAIWLTGITLWYQHNIAFGLLPQQPWPWLYLTIACSIILLALYKPIMLIFQRRPESQEQVKDDAPNRYEIEQQFQQYRG